MEATVDPLALLQFYADIGVDEPMGDAPVDRFNVTEKQDVLPMPPVQAAPSVAPAPPVALPAGTFEALAEAQALAAGAATLDALRAALEGFEGLSLKRTATQIVFADGNPAARIMIVGEAPGADEDRVGKPFAGASGQMLDRMFAAIGMSREESLYLSSVMYWRPPGNRAASEAEIALSLPFVRRHIELVAPAILILSGGVAAKALLESTQGFSRLRGRWMEYTSPGLASPIPALCMFHPAYLIQAPAQKAQAWGDLLSLKAKARGLGL